MSDEKKEAIQSQLQPTPQMTIGAGNRNAKGLPVDADGKRDWSFPLFGCLGDMSKCCWACWCPCIIHSQTRRRLDHLNRNGVPDPNPDKKINGDSVVYALIEAAFDMGWVLQIATRKDIRTRYNIRGSATSDCCTPFCCTACDLVQGAREVELEELSFKNESGAPQV
ncbi:PLAC8-domain-containing protein [Pholiota conissans]|uniref:PLAC8-domain-containing protein n=1 Tax=Pholiota conissans TaxID=109636 RepID=A0A9P6CVG9_9AGAR|nr:PLAC8-domain-containing protein [Pholiota conissans]